jgi:hypothetical protein
VPAWVDGDAPEFPAFAAYWPFPVAAVKVDMLIAMPGQQYSKRELSTMF